MRHAQSSVFERLSNALHMQFDAIAKEPLPERWVDLINYLNEKEEAQRRAHHWSERAEEARQEAVGMTNPQARREMLMIAAEIPAIGRARARADCPQETTCLARQQRHGR